MTRHRWQTCHVQPFLEGTFTCWLIDRVRLIFHDCPVATPFLLVRHHVQAIMHAIRTGINSSMPQFRTFRV